MSKPTRRDLLTMLTLGAGAGMFALSGSARGSPLSSILDSVLTATGAPKRIVFIDVPNGVTPGDNGVSNGYDEFVKAGPTPSEYSLGVLTQPLEPLREELVLIDNLEMKNWAGDTHFGGIKTLLTGRWPSDPKGPAAHMSIDLYLAEKLGKVLTPAFPSINLGVQSHSITRSYRMDGTPVPPNQDPYEVYKQMFSGLTSGGTAPDPLALHRLGRRKSVLDFVAKDITNFRARLSGSDRQRADAQLESIRTMEQRLSDGLETTQEGSTACAAPGLTAGIDPYERVGGAFPALSRMQIDNIVAAFACDLTRVACLLFRGREYQVYKCGFDPMTRSDLSFHELSHKEIANDGYAAFRKGKAFLFQLVGELAQKLKSIPEGDGNMLDNTIIFVGTEIGRSHENSSLQFLTLGGKNLGVNRNRLLELGSARGRGNGVAHNRLLVSFLNAMGLPDQTFGESPGTGSGPLPGYLL